MAWLNLSVRLEKTLGMWATPFRSFRTLSHHNMERQGLVRSLILYSREGQCSSQSERRDVWHSTLLYIDNYTQLHFCHLLTQWFFMQVWLRTDWAPIEQCLNNSATADSCFALIGASQRGEAHWSSPSSNYIFITVYLGLSGYLKLYAIAGRK